MHCQLVKREKGNCIVSYTSFYTVYGFISLDRNTINRFIALPDNALIDKVQGAVFGANR